MKQDLSFGVSTWLWTSPFTTQTTELFGKIKAMGFDAVEIPVEYPELIDGKAVREALQRHDLKPILCGVFGDSRDLTHEDASVRANCMEYVMQCFTFCEQWGAAFVAGPMYAAVGKARQLPQEQRQVEWSRAVEHLRILCHRAGDRGLSIALEPLNRFESDLVNTAADVMRLVRDIDHPAARVLLDGFHMSIEEKNLEEAFVSVGDRLVHVQVSENHRGIPGSGQTSWLSFRQGLERINYRGVVSIESFTPDVKELAGAVCIWKQLAPSQDDFAREGLQFLKKLLHATS